MAAAITVRNYLNMVLDNAGIKLPEGREESRRIKNLPGQIDQMIIASVADVFSENKSEIKATHEDLDPGTNVPHLEMPAKKGSFKRTK